MARPVNADPEATKLRILERSLELFAEKGVSGASIREIAKASDVSLATIHHYFGSKDGLAEACIEKMDRRLMRLAEELMRRARPDDSGSLPIASTVREAYRLAREYRGSVQLLLRLAVSDEGLPRARREEKLAPFLDTATQTLGAALGRRPEELRLPLQTMIFLTARYVAASPADLLVGAGEEDLERAHKCVEEHLVEVAESLFLPIRA
ncbi:MAG: TetR/AcrR family transcriptional regulator [Sandaracinaceae bacterium]|nr:TetR/AcrR family transcriptional regulator [Sandaracinaceae bacterium]